jgi:hypothetical protein
LLRTPEHRVLTQELSLAAIVIPCLQQRVDNTCIDFKEVSSADGGGHPRILTCLNHALLGWFDVRFAQKTTKLLRGSEMTLSANRVILQCRKTASLSASPTMKNVTDLPIEA